MTDMITLASTSPIRRAMLAQAGIAHDAVSPDCDEDALKAAFSGNAAELAAILAKAKALSVPVAGHVIGSDSVLEVDGRIFSKPSDKEEAAEHLRFFSGKVMQLSSAVALASEGAIQWHHVETAHLKVRELDETFIADYLDAEWPQVAYCVGVFRMEARGVTLFESVEGNHFTILGMPLLPLLGALRARGLIA